MINLMHYITFAYLLSVSMHVHYIAGEKEPAHGKVLDLSLLKGSTELGN